MLFQHFRAQPIELEAIGVCALVGVVLGAIGWVFLYLVPEPARAASRPAVGFRAVFRAALANSDFRRLLSSRAWMFFWVNVGMPTWHFLSTSRAHLGIPLWTLKLWDGFSGFCNAHGSRVCGVAADRYGYKPVAMLATLGVGTIPIWWMLARREVYWWAAGASIIGAWCWSGVNLCSSNLVLKMAPAESNTIYVAVYQAITSVMAGFGALFGGWLADEWTNLAPLELGAWTLSGLQLVFLISAFGRWSSFFWLWAVPEKGARSVRMLLGLMLTRIRPLSPAPDSLPLAPELLPASSHETALGTRRETPVTTEPAGQDARQSSPSPAPQAAQVAEAGSATGALRRR